MCYLFNHVPSSILHGYTPFFKLYIDKTMFELTRRIFIVYALYTYLEKDTISKILDS